MCCEASQGLKPGDPVFAAWVRLAATPVREIKSRVPDDRPERGRGRGGPAAAAVAAAAAAAAAAVAAAAAAAVAAAAAAAAAARDDSGRASREDMQKHAFGGRVGAKIVIPGFENMPDPEPEDETPADE